SAATSPAPTPVSGADVPTSVVAAA
ncbi:MAG: hypothetical protein JWR82_1811, partial [Blastococcus sp.]|nr:hypothetical protein [Blastococcus sp.]